MTTHDRGGPHEEPDPRAPLDATVHHGAPVGHQDDVHGHLAAPPSAPAVPGTTAAVSIARPSSPPDGRVPTTTAVRAPVRLLAGAAALLAVDVAAADGGRARGEVRALLDSGTEPGAEVGRAPVDEQGRALLTVVLPRGEHVLRVAYSGSDDHAPSAAAPRVLRVVAHPTLVALSSDSATAPAGEPVVLTARVTSGDTAPVPTGSVVFHDGEHELGSARLDATGTAVLTTRGLATGVHRVVASYQGDPAHGPSRSAAMPQAVAVRVRPTALRLAAEVVDDRDALVTVLLVDPDTGAVHTRATGEVVLTGVPAGERRVPLDRGSAQVLVVDGASLALRAHYPGDAEHLAGETA
jgi:hypothetical protein